MSILKELITTAAKDPNCRGIQEDTERVQRVIGGMLWGDAQEIFAEAYGTEWFDKVVIDKAHNRLMKGFGAVPDDWRKVCEIVNLDDLKARYATVFSGVPYLPQKEEHHGFAEARFSDRQESYTPLEYGRIFSITKTAKVNDQIGAFGRWAEEEGKAAARSLNRFIFYTCMDANPTVGGANLFDAVGGTTHNNAIATKTVLSKAGVDGCMARLGAQTGERGEALHFVGPFFLAVHPINAITAYEITSDILKVNVDAVDSLVQTSEPNTYGPSGRFPIQVIVTPYIASGSNADYYLLTADAPLFEIGFLNGKQTPELLQEQYGTGASFTHNEYRFRTSLDFGGCALEWRGMVFGDAA